MRLFGTLFGMAFGLLFAAAGLFVAQQTVIPTYLSWLAMQDWRATSAVLLSVSGSENSTEASYRYQVDGVEYQGDRVYVAEFNDNIGSYHQDFYQRLRQMKEQGVPVSIWFDSDSPGQSVIDRDMRWGLFALMTGFCSVFILIGLGVCLANIRGAFAPKKASKRSSLSQLREEWKQSKTSDSFFEFIQQKSTDLAEQSVKQTQSGAHLLPWLNKKEWRNNRIRSSAKTGLYFMWGFAILWSGISSPILFVLEDEINQENYAVLIALLFPLIGLLMLYKAWQMTREWIHFGVIELELDPFPGSIGGHVGGSLLITKTIDFRAPYNIELECVYSYMSGSGDNRSRRENIKWSEQGFAKAEATGRGLRLEFRFDVPEDLPEADVDQTNSYYFWRLRLSAEVDGIELRRDYNIPVFMTRTQSKYVRHDNSGQAAELRKEQAMVSAVAINRGDFAQTALARAFRYEDTGQEQIFYYPMFRNKLLTLFALIFAGGFDFAGVSINREFGSDGFMAIGMLIFSLPFLLVGIIATIALIYLPLNNLRVTLANRRITAMRRLLFIPIQYHSINGYDIRNIEIKSNASTGSGAKQIKHYQLIVHGKHGQKFTIAEGIDGEDIAGQLKDFIAKRLGLAV